MWYARLLGGSSYLRKVEYGMLHSRAAFERVTPSSSSVKAAWRLLGSGSVSFARMALITPREVSVFQV